MARKFHKNQSNREPFAHKYAIPITIQRLKRPLKEAQFKVPSAAPQDVSQWMPLRLKMGLKPREAM